MRRLILLIGSSILFCSNFAQSVSVTATSGTLSGSYATLKLAFDNINNGTHKGAITINIIANTTEVASAVLSASGGAVSYTTINIQPSGGAARTISGSLAAPLLDLNGADNVTIDGLNSGGNSLTISNTSTSNLTNTSTIRFILGATNNTIRNSVIEGSETNVAYGTILFSTATGAGNDGNTISNNTITSAGGNLPFNGIYSAGTSVAIDNSSISILNNNIQDYYNPVGASNGVVVASNSSSWTITGNKFFQTATRTSTAAATCKAINIISASGTGYDISNNTIGFANATGTGITTYAGAFANIFRGIEMTVGTSPVSVVQGNTIAGVSFSTTSASALPGIFSAISVLAGSVNIGTTSGNTIGSTTGNGSIGITSTSTAALITGIYSTSTGTVDIENNNVGAISTTGSSNIGYTFHGIYTTGALGNYIISSNTIGSSATSNSLSIGDAGTTTGVCSLNGITHAATGTISIISNSIQNVTAFGTGASVLNGILNSAGSGTLNITSNNVIAINNTGTGVVAGISNTAATATTANINSNNILSTSLSGTGTFVGISNASTVATTNVNLNVVRNISRTTATGAVTGISSTGAITVALNINNNQLGNTSGGFVTYGVANSSALIGITVTTATSASDLSIQNNDIMGIAHTVSGSNTNTYIINTAATHSQNINNNTFTNLVANTSGSVTFISNSVVLPANGIQNITGNNIVTGFNKTVAGGTVTLFTSTALTVASGVTVNHTGNNFSNITITGATIIAGWVHTDAGTSLKTITGNTFNNWTGGTSAITCMTLTGFGGTSSISSNTITNVTGQAAITGLTIGASGSSTLLSIMSNTITNLISSGTGGTVVALASANLSPSVNIDANVINSLSSSGTTASVTGINVTAGVNVSITNHNIHTLLASGITTPIINGIIAASTGTVSIQTNTVYNISTSGIATSGYTFNGIITSGAAGNFTISGNTIGSTVTPNSVAIGTNGVTTTGVCTFNGIVNTSSGTTSVSGNIIQNCSVYGAAASVFNGIVNSNSTGALSIISNGIRYGTHTGTGGFTCVSNSAAASTANISFNIARNNTRTAASGSFIGISNTGAVSSSLNISSNQIGNANGGALTISTASAGSITGITNTGGTATTTININSNLLDGFSVVSSGAFTGIVNGGASTGVAININSNQIGTTTGTAITYSAANSTALIGISNTGGASTCALSIQSNDIRGIVHSVSGTSAHTYIINSAATLSQNITSNTFTNLNVNTTGSIIFISDNVVPSATGTQTINTNSISGTFTRTGTSASGALTLFNSVASSVAGSVISNSNNNFSNITISGTATIAGWINTDAGGGTKTIQGNTFSNWTAGTGMITAMNVNIGGAGNAITGNIISNFNSAANINGITTGAGNDNIYLNTISSLVSTGAGATLVNGISVTAGTLKNIYQNNISGLQANFSNLTGAIQNSLAVNGILVSGGTTVNVYENIIYGCTADAIDAGTLNGVTISGGLTVSVYRNKIYDLSSASTAINSGGINGILIFNVAGSATTLRNNTIGDIRTPLSGNTDALRGISINAATVSNINVYYNTIYLNATSSGTNFGCTGIFHSHNATSSIGQLDMRNNIIYNISTANGTGQTVAFRRYGTALNNYATTSNNNLFYAGTPGPARLIFNDATNSDQTIAAFQVRLVNRDGQSFTEDLTNKFMSLSGSSANFLHMDSTKISFVESGGANIGGITMDYDSQIRQGNPGYTGTGSAPDVGADEYEGMDGLWTGNIGTDWTNVGNWATRIPTASGNAVIPNGRPNYPFINAGTVSIRNLTIYSAASVTVSAAIFQIGGTISNSGIFNAANGSIEMNGSAAQTISANTFQFNAIQDLIVSNTSAGGLSLGGALNIFGSLTYSGSGKKLNTNDSLTLKSTISGTAWVGDMTGNTITGKVSVERYISARKAWRFLSIPTNTTQTIKQAWQEGCGANVDCVAEFGTQITGAGGTAAGFDIYSSAPSLKTYDSATDTWIGVPNTTSTFPSPFTGYMTFVRGDRSATSTASIPTETVLRTTGNLYKGTLTPISVAPSRFASIGNPYVASLDMRNISRTGIKDFFYVWDPYLSGTYGFGGYQTFSLSGSDYVITPGGGSYGVSGSISNFIPSGQAFFVQGMISGGSVTFDEGAKTTGSIQASRPMHAPGQQLRANLYGVNADGSVYIADGIFVNYNNNYSNNVDDLDAFKSVNSNENLSIKNAGSLLVIERRHSIDQNDTIFLNMGGVRAQAYRFEIIAEKLNETGMVSFIEDSYTGRRTPVNLNGNTQLDFTVVNIPASYAPNRFRIVFMPAAVLPLTFTNIRAYQENADIKVQWKVENENNMLRYNIEKSTDGNNYKVVDTIKANNATVSLYNWIDGQTSPGYNYYRIKSIDKSEKIEYSKVVKVFISLPNQSITIYPNPIKDGIINVQLANQPKGLYLAKLLNSNGEIVFINKMEHAERNSTQKINIRNILSRGVYSLQITTPDGKIISNKLMY